MTVGRHALAAEVYDLATALRGTAPQVFDWEGYRRAMESEAAACGWPAIFEMLGAAFTPLLAAYDARGPKRLIPGQGWFYPDDAPAVGGRHV